MSRSGNLLLLFLFRFSHKIRLLLLIGCCLNANEFRVALLNEGHGFSRAWTG
jgi:hypothetical protein